MSLYVGFMCPTCGEFIKVGEQLQGAAIIYVAELEPYPCKECGSSYLYRSDDFVDEAGKPLPYASI